MTSKLAPLQQYATARKIVVGAKGGKNDKVDILCRDACPLNGDFGRFHAHGGSGFVGAMGPK